LLGFAASAAISLVKIDHSPYQNENGDKIKGVSFFRMEGRPHWLNAPIAVSTDRNNPTCPYHAVDKGEHCGLDGQP
jgi:hypothetical protein